MYSLIKTNQKTQTQSYATLHGLLTVEMFGHLSCQCLTGFELYMHNKCLHCYGSVQTDETCWTNNLARCCPTLMRVGQYCYVLLTNNVAFCCPTLLHPFTWVLTSWLQNGGCCLMSSSKVLWYSVSKFFCEVKKYNNNICYPEKTICLHFDSLRS